MQMTPKHLRIKDIREISIAIDVWDDIFSDFDPRPLDERALSEDFITELKKRYRETPKGDYIISITAPAALKDEKSELMVIHRLKEHFAYRMQEHKHDIAMMRVRGAAFVAMGMTFLTFLFLGTYYKILSDVTMRLLEIVLMPLGWFGVWEGFGKFADASPKHFTEVELYGKLSGAEYRFYYGVDKVDVYTEPSK